MIVRAKILPQRAIACCVTTTIAVMVLAGCGFSGESGNVSDVQGSEQNEELASDAQLARKPAILRTPRSVDADLPHLLERVPREVRRPVEQIRRIPNTSSSRRYWLTPWQGPKGDFSFSCLYAISPGEDGIGTSCYSDRQLETGSAISFALMDGRLEFIGFNPDPRGRAVMRFKDRSENVPVRDGVFIGSSKEFPESIHVVSGKRSFNHRVPSELKQSSG